MARLRSHVLTGLASLALLCVTPTQAVAGAPAPQDAGEPEVAQPVPQELPRKPAQPRKQPAGEGASLAEDGNTAPSAETLAADQLDELVAPVALYPDVLLNQMLVACETPGDLAAADKLAGRDSGPIQPAKSWSPGVIALMHVPSVLHWLDESKLWSSQLGTTYKSHPRDVIAAIQRVRKKAQELGNLSSDEQRDVADAFGKITIGLTDPGVLHVPIYDPTQVLLQHTADCPGWFSYGPTVTIPGFKNIEAGFRSIEFTRAKKPQSASFYKPAPPLVPTVTTTVKRGGGGGGLRWLLRGNDRHDHDHHRRHH